jgi:two-component system sensor histidine kinase YesM
MGVISKMKKLLEKINSISISWKFTLIYFVLIMIPTATIVANGYQKLIDSVKQQSDKNVSQRIFQFKQNILYTIKNAEDIAEEIVFANEFQAFLDNYFTFSADEIDNFIYNVQDKLISIKHLYPNKFFKIRIFTSNKSSDETYDILYYLDRIANKDYFREIVSSPKKKLWGNIKKAEEYYDVNVNINLKQNKNIVIPLYVRITTIIDNKLIGVLEIDILVEKMFGDLSELLIGNNGYLFVLDNHGKVINFDEKNRLRHFDPNLFPGDNGVKEITVGKQMYRVQYETVKETGFKIMAAIPESDFLNEVAGQKKMLIYTILAGVAAVFLITFLTTNFLFARLKVMVKMMKRIQNGEFEVRIADQGRDEIGQLAGSFNQMAENLEGVMLNLIEQETAHRDAEIRALQSQINPHFIFNTLESLRMECELRKEYDLAKVLTSLGSLFRYNIKWVNYLVPLREEIEHIKNYIVVMQIRFGDRVHFNINIDEALYNYLVIKMMLQPLVENCFYHAFQNLEGIWRIDINGKIEGENLDIEILDNGTGIDPDRLNRINLCLASENDAGIDKKAEGFIGLWNVAKRIKMQFGNEWGIRLDSVQNVGTKIMITIPAKQKGLNQAGRR